MKTKIVNLLNTILSRFGFVLVGKQWLKENTFRIVDLRPGECSISPMDALSFYSLQKLMYVLNIPTERIVTSKPMRAWIETVRLRDKEEEATPLTERPSFLYLQNFYNQFQPRNVAERLEITKESQNENSQKFLESHPLFAVLPWDIVSPDKSYKYNYDVFFKECIEYGGIELKKEDGYNVFGPVSQRLLEMEYNRLISVYNSIKTKGYDEKHGYPKAGSIFVSGKEYKLSIVGGRHRVAVMLALHYEYIPITISKDKAVRLERKEVDTWYHIKSGLFSREQALELFDMQIVIE